MLLSFNFMGGFYLMFYSPFLSSRLICSFWFMLYFGNHFMFSWLILNFRLYFWYLLSLYFDISFWWHNFWLSFMLNFVFRLVFSFVLNFMLNFMLNFVLNFMFRFVFNLMLDFMLNFMLRLVFYDFRLLCCGLRLLSFFRLVGSLLLFRFFLILSVFLGSLFELFRHISNSSPIFSMLFLLSSHFDKESSGKNLFVKARSDEIDGINFALKDNFKGSRVVFLDLDQVKVWKSLLNILLNCIEVAFDEVQ